jgi:hypothetical protein
MKLRRKWVVAFAVCVAAVLVGAVWISSELSKCQYRESTPTYSPDKKFYTQMQFTVCQDHAKSHASLVMGEAGKQGKAVLLDLGSSIGTLDLSWHEGPELHVQAAESAIIKHYGPYDDLPRVVVTNP